MEDEYEVGEYYRTKNGEILKIVDLDEYGFLVDKFYYQIVKHSKNIIDLVEIGDYVNRYRVVAIMEDMETGEIHLEMTSDYTNEIIGDCTIYNDDIKSIVTHEQFANVEYKVETEDK